MEGVVSSGIENAVSESEVGSPCSKIVSPLAPDPDKIATGQPTSPPGLDKALLKETKSWGGRCGTLGGLGWLAITNVPSQEMIASAL